MLVLTRKTNERIVLPELGVAITILEVRGDKVRVGVSAPPGAKVCRQEGSGTAGPHVERSPSEGPSAAPSITGAPGGTRLAG